MRGGSRSGWMPVFWAAVAVFALSVGAASVAGIRLAREGEAAGSKGGVVPHVASDGPLLVPADYATRLDPRRFKAAGPGEPLDIAIEPSRDGTGVAVRTWVPVISWHTGIEVVAAQSVAGLGAGAGEPGHWNGRLPETLVVEGDRAAAAALGWAAATRVPTYDELWALMRATFDRPLIALVPMEKLAPGATPLSLDGIDPVRGAGDLAKWPLTERISVRALTPRAASAVPLVEQALAEVRPAVTRIVATGDILMSRCTLAKIEASGDWASPFRTPVGDFLRGADLALGSLDGAIQDIAPAVRCVSGTNLSSPPQVIEALIHAGFDEVTVATNHVFDCGQGGPCGSKAFLRTLDLVRGAGIKTVGGGANLEEALAPAIFEVNGIRVGVLGVDDIAAEDLQATESAPGTAPMDDSYADEKSTPPREPAFYKPASMLSTSRVEERIRRLKQQVDIVVIQVQSGYEDTHEASPRSIKALRAFADAGADLVIGNQAHWTQGVEVRGERFIAYALGNFIFDQVWTPEHTQCYLVEAVLHGKRVATVRLLPCVIKDQYQATFAENGVRTKILGDIFGASAKLP